MKNYIPVYILFLCLAIIFTACTSGENADQMPEQIHGEGLQIDEAWARPAGEGKMSAGYFRVSNFEDSADTLTGIHSNAAQRTEVHESFEQDDGMMGMREVPKLPVPGRSAVEFEPGGIHIMFIQLTEALEEGDEIELVLTFANHGDKTVALQVRP